MAEGTGSRSTGPVQEGLNTQGRDLHQTLSDLGGGLQSGFLSMGFLGEQEGGVRKKLA